MRKNYKGGFISRSLRGPKRGARVVAIIFIVAYIFVINRYYMVPNSEGTIKATFAQNVETQVQVKEVAQEPNNDNFKLSVDTDLTVPSGVTAEQINKVLEGTLLAGMGETYVEAETLYGVNAVYMVGLACEESGFGTSSIAKVRNNLYGYAAYDSNPWNAKGFSSKEEGTLFVARKLAENYLAENGCYHEGVTPRSIDVHYCTDKEHADKICNVIASLRNKLD